MRSLLVGVSPPLPLPPCPPFLLLFVQLYAEFEWDRILMIKNDADFGP